MRRGTIGTSLALLAFAGCNALTGASDLETGEPASCAGCGPDAQRDAGAAADAAADVAAAALDGGLDVEAGLLRPSYCAGITLYVPFDGTLTARSGQPPTATPVTPFVMGRFGMGVDLGGATTALFYATSYAGQSTYSSQVGTVAFWLKVAWSFPCGAPRVFFKPKTDSSTGGTPSAGPMVECDVGGAGIVETVPLADGGRVGTMATASPSWSAGGWNLVTATWSRTKPELELYAPGTQSTSAVGWTPIEPTAGALRLGSTASVPQAAFDELVVWDRQLSLTDVNALRAASTSVGDACGL